MSDLGARGGIPPKVDTVDLIHGKEDSHVMCMVHASAFGLYKRLSTTDFDAGGSSYRNENRLREIAAEKKACK